MSDQVNEDSFINDSREASEFKTVTFSGYKTTDVKRELLLALYNAKIENACYWSAELVCAGHFMDAWEFIIFYLGKHVHLGNPKLAIYIDKRFQVFRNIMLQELFYNELQLRNSSTIRQIFAEICCVLATSPKKPTIESVKINKEEEFDMTQISLKLKATSTLFAEPILKKNDPAEIAISVNEFAFHLTSNAPNMSLACYWIEWLIAFDRICKQKKHNCFIESRTNIPVEYKFQKELIWILWDALFFSIKDDKFSLKIMHSILNLFCIKFTPSCIKKRVHLLYFAVSVVTEPYRRTVPMIHHIDTVENTLTHINTVYKQIKSSEISPKTDYLFSGLKEKSNLAKTVGKIELLNSMDILHSG